MKINDKRRPIGWDASISNRGALFTPREAALVVGDVVSLEGSTGFYLLCRENAHNPIEGTSGQTRWFLVGLVDGARLPMQPNDVFHITKVNAELTIKT